jgi:hypothetical protein
MRIPIALAALLAVLVWSGGCFCAVQGPVEDCECPAAAADAPTAGV